MRERKSAGSEYPLAPHPPLRSYYATSADREQYVTELFDRTASHYEWICRVMSFGSGQRYRRQALARSGLSKAMRVLDVATGTGLVARAAVDLVGDARHVVGLDPCRGMLLESRKTDPHALVQAWGECLPFKDNLFDLISNGYALRHVSDLEHTFQEYRRVLKPGGRILLLEISRPRSRTGLHLMRFYLGKLVPLIARIGTRSQDVTLLMKYFRDTIEKCVSPEVILAALTRSGLREVERRVFLGIFSEYIALK